MYFQKPLFTKWSPEGPFKRPLCTNWSPEGPSKRPPSTKPCYNVECSSYREAVSSNNRTPRSSMHVAVARDARVHCRDSSPELDFEFQKTGARQMTQPACHDRIERAVRTARHIEKETSRTPRDEFAKHLRMNRGLSGTREGSLSCRLLLLFARSRWSRAVQGDQRRFPSSHLAFDVPDAFSSL